VPTSFSLAPGAYRLYLDKVIALPPYVQLPVKAAPIGALSYFAIQPNPVQDLFWLNFSLLENTDIYLEIRDMAGKVLERQHFDNLPAGAQQVEIKSPNWQPGVYFAVLRDAKGGVSTRKLVKI